MLLCSPDTLCALLFTEILGDNEALEILGTPKISNCRGYSYNTLYDGKFVSAIDHQQKLDNFCCLRRHIIAIDASYFKKPADNDQSTNFKRP